MIAAPKSIRSFSRKSFAGKTSSGRSVYLATFIAVALLPNVVGAQVVISEFLYDAPGADTDQEFVELFNAGSAPVDLTAWKLNDGSNHTLNVPPKNGGTGSISIAPGAYMLLVNDAAAYVSSHAGISTSVIDTVLSLTNTAGTISLIDEAGAFADSISYTKDQGGAGDGNSLQKAGSNWVAAAPTPGTLNATAASAPPADTRSNTSSTAASTTGSSVSSYVAPPEQVVFADAGKDRIVIVGADIAFIGHAYDRRKEPITDHVRFAWNFGDGSTGEGASLLHHFEYPGRSAVVLTVAQGTDTASDRVTVTAEPARLAFSALSDGSAAIENHAGHDLDLTHWIVSQLGRDFVLPESSIILSGTSMRISQKTLGFYSGSSTELRYPNGVLALRAGERSEDVAHAPTSQTIPAPVAQVSAPANLPTAQAELSADEASQTGSGVAVDQPADAMLEDGTPVDATSSEVAAAASTSGSSYRWWLGAFCIAALAAGSLFAARRFGKREWNIEEM